MAIFSTSYFIFWSPSCQFGILKVTGPTDQILLFYLFIYMQLLYTFVCTPFTLFHISPDAYDAAFTCVECFILITTLIRPRFLSAVPQDALSFLLRYIRWAALAHLLAQSPFYNCCVTADLQSFIIEYKCLRDINY